LSPYVTIREDALIEVGGKPLHLEMEVSRVEYEEMIRPLVESTLDSVSKALQDSGKGPSDMDAVLLVGGSVRTPLLFNLLADRIGLEPARGRAIRTFAWRWARACWRPACRGHGVGRVLVDVSPYSFGISFLGERGGVPYPHCYKPIVRRNTPLPLTRTEQYVDQLSFSDGSRPAYLSGGGRRRAQEHSGWRLSHRGLERSALAPNEILCRSRLDLDGVLEVAARGKRRTGKSKTDYPSPNALAAKSPEEIAAARKRSQELF